MRNGIIISVLLIKAIFLQVNKYIFQLANIRLFAKVLILTTRICLPLVLRNKSFLKRCQLWTLIYNFGLTRYKDVGPKAMEYLSFWLIYILMWCNLCILNKRQQFTESTLQNGILGQGTKNNGIFMFSFEWLKRNRRPFFIWTLYRG